MVEPNDPDVLLDPDSMTVAPWSVVFACEDGGGIDRVVGITPDGETFVFARNATGSSELVGATFSPDGTVLFLDLYGPGVTPAITGRW